MKLTRNSAVLTIGLALVATCLIAAARPAFNPIPYYAPEKSMEVQGVKLVYLEAGSGTPILFIHGFCGNAFNWSEVFGPLSKNYQVIVPDLPGYGKSGCPPQKEKQIMLWYADFLAEFLDQLGVKKAVVVGNSMGGSIAAWMAIRHPEKVDKLVLEDAAGLKGGKLGLFKGVAEMVPASQTISLIHAIFPTDPATEAKSPVSEQKRVEVSEARYNSDLAPCSSKIMKWSIVSMGKNATEPVLGKISMPTLIIWGSNDDLLPVATAEKFHAKIPGSRVEIIDGGVHTPMQWRPEAFMKVLEGFIQSP
jgi:pimeloyl-ACP methyl ester carboxylesterase